jgi:hypothetical protein
MATEKGFIKYLIEEIADLNVSTKQLKTMGCYSRFQSDIVQGGNNSCLS